MKLWLVAGSGARERAFAEQLARSSGAAVVTAARGEGATRIERNPAGFQVVRADPAPEHWQRSRSGEVAALVRALAAEERPDVVHVLGRRGLSHDLVATLAGLGVRVVLSPSDASFACLVGDRVRRDAPGPGACAAPLAPMPCLGCAEAASGRTPWVPIEARFLAVAERRRDALRELAQARRVIVADAAAEDELRRALGDALATVAFAHVADARDAALHERVYRAVLDEPAPGRVDAQGDWWSARMQGAAESAWDEAFLAAGA